MADITMTPVASTNLAEVGYDAASKELRISFQSGALYRYFGVPEGVYEGFLSGQLSAGDHFKAAVKGVYAYERIG